MVARALNLRSRNEAAPRAAATLNTWANTLPLVSVLDHIEARRRPIERAAVSVDGRGRMGRYRSGLMTARSDTIRLRGSLPERTGSAFDLSELRPLFVADGLRSPLGWCLGGLLGRWCLGRLLGRWCLGGLLGRWCLGRLLGRWCLSRLLGRWCLSGLLGRWCLSGLLGRWCVGVSPAVPRPSPRPPQPAPRSLSSCLSPPLC